MASFSQTQVALLVAAGAVSVVDAFAPSIALPHRAARAGGCSTALRMGPAEMPHKKVVVTGLGVVSPLGTGVDAFFEGLFAAKSPLSKLPEWADEFPAKVAGVVTEFNAQEWYGNKKEANRQSRYMHFGIAASKLAVKDAQLDTAAIKDRSRYGVLIGSAIGGSEYYEDAGTKWSAFSKYDELGSDESELFAGRNSVYKVSRPHRTSPLGLCSRLGDDNLSDVSANCRLRADTTGNDNSPQGSYPRTLL